MMTTALCFVRSIGKNLLTGKERKEVTGLINVYIYKKHYFLYFCYAAQVVPNSTLRGCRSKTHDVQTLCLSTLLIHLLRIIKYQSLKNSPFTQGFCGVIPQILSILMSWLEFWKNLFLEIIIISIFCFIHFPNTQVSDGFGWMTIVNININHFNLSFYFWNILHIKLSN